jgi:acylphosphatase
MNFKRTIAALGVAALVACPAGATAKGPHGGGKGKAPQSVQDDTGSEGKKPKKPKKQKVANYEFKGTVAAVGDGTVEVTITGGNRRARELERQVVTFDVTDAKVKVADVNGDGERNLADVAVGDVVKVQAKVAGPVSSSKVVTARRLLDKGPAKPPSDDDADDDTPKAPETETPAPPVTEAPAA